MRLIPFVALLGLLVLGCGQDRETGGGAPTPATPRSVAVLGTVPDFTLVDQQGSEFASESLHGKLWVADFVFTRCTQACPMLTARMAELQHEMQDDPVWPQVQLVSFSVDPDYDQPAVLTEYAERYRADSAHWTFLTGERGEIWKLSGDGFKLPVGDSPGDVGNPLFHSDRFVLVDREGRIRGYYAALEDDGFDSLVKDLRTVAAENGGVAAEPARLAQAQAQAPAPDAPLVIVRPAEAENPSWLPTRAAEQIEGSKGWDVFHDFGFRDAVDETGIDWKHSIVDDAGKAYKAVHYDHGTGVAVADVDGDGLYDLLFVNQLGKNGLFRNLGGGKFEDISASAGIELGDRVCVGASFADTDNDGDPDLYITSVRGGNVLFENDGKGHFRDISEQSGLGYVGHSSGAVFFDYDRDGLLDLFLLNIGVYTRDVHGPGGYWVGHKDAFSGHLKPERKERSLLYRNEGGNRFVDVSAAVGLDDTRWSGDATPIDANGDGWPDLYVLNMQGLDGYYENQKGQRFVDRSEELFPRTSWGAMGVKAFDFENDGDMDIFISDMHSDMSIEVAPSVEKKKSPMQWPDSFLVDGGKGIYGNTFFRAEADGSFTEVSDEIGAENFWPWGLSVGDVNADGWDDAFVTASMNYPFRYGINSLLLNDRGRRFLDAEFVLGVEPRAGGTTVEWFELDCAGEDRYHEDCPKDRRAGRVIVKTSRGTRSSVIFDLDGDGDLDIVTNEFNDRPQVLVSNLSEKKPVRYLLVKPVGTRSNRDGLGARVTVRAGDRTWTKVHDGLSGYLSKSSYPLYFGLGDAGSVDEIRVQWPSGAEQTLAGPIQAGKQIEIVEPK